MNKFQKTLGGLTLATGIALFGIQNYDEIGRTLQKTTNYVERKVNKVSDSIFIADAKFNDYKGEWEPYTVQPEDGKSPIWKVSRKCTKELGANSEHWREQIKKYNKSQKIELTKPLQVGNRFYVPIDCKCQSYGKK
jgi:hypothetical protein